MADAAASRWIEAPPTGWQVLRRNKVAMVSLGFIIAVTLFAIVTPFFLNENIKHESDDSFFRPLQTSTDGTRFHLLGTDLNGRDLFYQLVTGAQVSLGVGLVGALVSLVIGGVYGMVSGYAGGRVDGAMMRLVDILNSIPSLLFVMIFISAFDDYFKDGLHWIFQFAQDHGWEGLAKFADNCMPYSRIGILVLSLGLVQWLTMARIVRGQVLVLKELAFVTASQAMGQRWWGILWKHLWPNLSTIVLTYLTLTIPAVIRDESFLSFLGLGIADPAASWGSLLKDGAQVINPLDSKWWLLVFPAALMSASLLALNFLGDGLRDAFDPRSSEG
jgi:peptide/nickel transport system permease protein/oligopeptide transport system permease protein